jgi:CheY-like chemotaxis protein
MHQLILVVEDHSHMHVGMAAMLTEVGYDVIAVSSVAMAMQVLATERPDLLLARLELDGSTGLQVVALNPHSMPTVVVSGFRDDLIERETRLLGADYLTQPTPDALLQAIRQKLTHDPQSPFQAARRWARRAMPAGCHVLVEHWPARVLDVSDGGVRLEVERGPGAWLPLSFRLTVPESGKAVPVEVVWKRRRGDHTWICGASVAEEHRRAWRQLIAMLSSERPLCDVNAPGGCAVEPAMLRV